jgi:DNA topoisomerase-6 subunit B
LATANAKRKRKTSRLGGADANGAASNGSHAAHGKVRRTRRATAESMAASQRDISVSEFFAKNRHLLGFDNPRKALLTTIKEAVDNSLDACEEAGILPEIWVHVEQTGPNRYKAGIQDNGPGIVKKQIPLIFGKLLYGSKFHRLRMSRGQQGIGISAAGMYGVMTTGKPIKIISKISIRKPLHYYEIKIDTKQNKPQILNGRGDGVDIPAGDKGFQYIAKHGIEWATHYDAEEGKAPQELRSGTRVTIELEAIHKRGRGSVDEYLEQTAIANPHVTLHYVDPEGNQKSYRRSAEVLPPEPKEIKPHPYGIELGTLIEMLHSTNETTLASFLTNSFSRVSPAVARRICEAAKVTTRANPARVGRRDADALYHALQPETTKISAPSTDCISAIGEELLLKGMYHVVPAEFYVAATRPPAVYRGNPFLVEVALAYGGASTAKRIPLELLSELIAETDSRTLRQFLTMTFQGLGPDAADKIVAAAGMTRRQSPGKLSRKDIEKLYAGMQNVSLDSGQTMNVMRYANRVPLQFKPGDCAISKTITNTNWRAYGLSQSRGSLPSGPVTILVHIASVWVPFTSESKEAVAEYPEIQKEIRLALQAIGRKLGMFLRRRTNVKKEADRRNTFLRYLGEVATAVSKINNADADDLYKKLLLVAKRKTSEADVKLDKHGRPIEEGEEEFGNNVIIVDPEEAAQNMINVETSNGNVDEPAE